MFFFLRHMYLSEMFHSKALISVTSDGASFVDSTEVYTFSLSFLRFKVPPVKTIFSHGPFHSQSSFDHVTLLKSIEAHHCQILHPKHG